MSQQQEWASSMAAYKAARDAGQTLVAAGHLARAKILADAMQKTAAADVALVENIGAFFDSAITKPANLIAETAGNAATAASKKLGEIGINLAAPVVLVGGIAALVIFTAKK